MLGGGIASNSTITIGNPNAQEISVTVNKKWDSSVAETDRKAVKVQLKVTGTLNGQTIDKVIDEATLDETGNWTHTFTGLPAEGRLNGLKYQVVEVGDEYESSVGAFQQDKNDMNHWTVTVTNKAKKPKDTTLTIPGTKTLNGDTLTAGQFRFQIKAKNPSTAPLPTDSTVANKADGSFSFGPITYKESDLNGRDSADFEYEITEVKGTDSTVTYDDAVYTVKVTVSKVSNRLNVTYAVFDKNGDTVDSIAFDNTVKPDKPDKPDQPTTPDTPNQPEQPNQPGKPDTPGTPGQPTTPTQPDKPQKPTLSVTGSSVTAAAVVTVLALACGLAMFVVRRHTAVNKTARSHHSR
nr:FctA domain-containing protein [Bifidobacterium sp. SO4]